ncbi:hypothetical protein BA895_20225 [Humibacillus sp. DSM 29435]|nr:hypothetical protein BA895_20225 [Humibacillus sp. DSM 29435]
MTGPGTVGPETPLVGDRAAPVLPADPVAATPTGAGPVLLHPVSKVAPVNRAATAPTKFRRTTPVCPTAAVDAPTDDRR